MKAVVVALLAVGMLSLAPALASAGEIPPCLEEPFAVWWCPPPYFGPYQMTVCGLDFDFVCMQ